MRICVYAYVCVCVCVYVYVYVCLHESVYAWWAFLFLFFLHSYFSFVIFNAIVFEEK